MADPRRGKTGTSTRRKVFVLVLVNPHGEYRIRCFAYHAKARRVARGWTKTKGRDASDSEWRGGEGRDDYGAYLYKLVIQ